MQIRKLKSISLKYLHTTTGISIYLVEASSSVVTNNIHTVVNVMRAIMATIPRRTIASERIYSINTDPTILTWIFDTLIYVVLTVIAIKSGSTYTFIRINSVNTSS